MLAAVGSGVYTSTAEAVSTMTSARRVDPDPRRAAECDERYRKWRSVYDLLQGWTL